MNFSLIDVLEAILTLVSLDLHKNISLKNHKRGPKNMNSVKIKKQNEFRVFSYCKIILSGSIDAY